MKNFEEESGIANNPSSIEEDNVPANPPENVKSAEEKHDAEITRLFDDARDKLEKVAQMPESRKSRLLWIWQKALRERLQPNPYAWK